MKAHTAGMPKTAADGTVYTLIGICTPVYLAVRFIITIAKTPKSAFTAADFNGLRLFICKNKITSAAQASKDIKTVLIISIISPNK